jgi:Uma2 family endonuclease
MLQTPIQVKVTPEDFDRFIALPENADRDYEHIGGMIAEVVSNNYSSLLAAIILAELMTYVRKHKLGWVTGADGGYQVSGEKYIPDVAFISVARQPQPSRDAYNPLAPDLAVEVLSPGNDDARMRIKVVNYLRAGATVWVVNPDLKTVEVYVPGQPPVVKMILETLDGGALIPGFSLAVKELFNVE